MSENHWWYLFHKEVKSRDFIQPGLEFDSFKPRLKSGIFKCISWLNGSFFRGADDRGFPKEEVNAYL
jgi:hypothetical protein